MGIDKTNGTIKHLIRKNKMDPKDNPFNGLSMEQLEEIAKSWQAAKKILQEKNREENPPKSAARFHAIIKH